MVTKVALSKPETRRVKDLTSPQTVQAIWKSAEEAVRKDAPAIRRRRNRTQKSV